MPARRSIIGRSLAGYLAAMCIVSLPTSLAQVEGRKCVCTSKACKEAGVDTCKTRFFCYTERILTTGQEVGESTQVTRGCTEGATPLLCETKSWATRSRSVNAVEPLAGPRVRVTWPKLKCCDNRDYCNADDENDDDDDARNASTWKKTRTERPRSSMDLEMLDDGPANRDAIQPTIQPDRKYDNSLKSMDGLLRDRVRALHVAALILAVAAFISVLASCYVVTRFLRSNRYVTTAVNYL